MTRTLVDAFVDAYGPTRSVTPDPRASGSGDRRRVLSAVLCALPCGPAPFVSTIDQDLPESRVGMRTSHSFSMSTPSAAMNGITSARTLSRLAPGKRAAAPAHENSVSDRISIATASSRAYGPTVVSAKTPLGGRRLASALGVLPPCRALPEGSGWPSPASSERSTWAGPNRGGGA